MKRVIALSSLCAVWACAEVRLPAVISEHMLVQRDTPVRIWGWADPAEPVSVRMAGQSRSTQADEVGRWAVMLAPVKAGGPYELEVKGTNAITVGDVLAGDVWIASGQSNMVWTVARSKDAQQEIASSKYPEIRLFKVATKAADYPLDDVQGSWARCSPDSVPGFSAVGYFFARDLHRTLKVPMGVIQTAWGGTPADSWTSLPALAADPALISVFADWAALVEAYPAARLRYEQALRKSPEKKPAPPIGPGHQWAPASLYNAMIAPLTPYAIRGAIWYQGENNAHKARSYVYRRLFPAMIQDWRRAWGQGDFPFLFVQLANYARTGPGSQWPELREAQTMTLQTANTGMAVTIDIGDANDIHPTNKQDVGHRLALAARSVAYGEKLVSSGPLYRQAAVEGGAIRVWFDHVGGGLVAKGGDLRGFQIAGADRKFAPAPARIEGETVLVSADGVPRPVYVRYAWADNPECNLFNAEALPAGPFRTDQ